MVNCTESVAASIVHKVLCHQHSLVSQTQLIPAWITVSIMHGEGILMLKPIRAGVGGVWLVRLHAKVAKPRPIFWCYGYKVFFLQCDW